MDIADYKNSDLLTKEGIGVKKTGDLSKFQDSAEMYSHILPHVFS